MTTGAQFMRKAEAIEERLLEVYSAFAADPDAVLLELQREVEELKRDSFSEQHEEARKAHILGNLESLVANSKEVVKAFTDRQRQHQTTIVDSLIKTVDLRARGLMSVSSYFEKLTVTGFGGIGVSVSLTGFLSAHSNPAHPLLHIWIVLLSLLLQFCAVACSIFGHHEIVMLTHEILQRGADVASSELRNPPGSTAARTTPGLKPCDAAMGQLGEQSEFWFACSQKITWARSSSLLLTVGLLALLAFVISNIILFRSW
jgi:hypothetical protein